MTALVCTVTNAGAAALIDAGLGGTTAVRIAKVGLSAAAVTIAPTLLALPGEFKRLDTISGVPVDDQTIHLTARDLAGDAYTVRSIGVYLDDGTLFAVYSQPAAIFEKAEVSTFYLAVDLKLQPGQATLVEFGDANFALPPASETVKGVAYLATIAEALAGAVADKIITPATMASVLDNYVAADRLGVINGVATLGPDGKLALAQRPPIDLIDVWPVADQAAMLALATATVGDFAVRADNGLIYVLQTLPAATLANWLEISTPAPVSSVNGKVGTVMLTAGDVGAAPATRQIASAGLISGGGSLAADRTLTVLAATAAEALAGVIANKALTPAALADILTLIASKAASGVSVTGAGLVTGGGVLTANRVLSVVAASAAEVAAGALDDRVVTPLGLAGAPKSLTPNGYYCLPGGLIIQWIAYRNIITFEQSIAVSWPIAFPHAPLVGAATGFLNAASIYRNLFAQIIAPNQYGGSIMLQKDSGVDTNLDGFDAIMLGF